MKAIGVAHLKIIAIGGGGFTHGTYPSLDDFCLEQTGKPSPTVGYIGTASQDDPEKRARFQDRFRNVATECVPLPMDSDADALAARLQGLDMVYVGGGNTEAMVAQWRKTGWDRALCSAARSGLTLAGVSAGAVCWFDNFLFHSGTGPMRPLRGLGLLRGGACPHYSTEPERQSCLHEAVAQRAMPESIAIDDGVAVAFDANGPTAVFSAEPAARAYRIRRNPDGTTFEIKLTC